MAPLLTGQPQLQIGLLTCCCLLSTPVPASRWLPSTLFPHCPRLGVSRMAEQEHPQTQVSAQKQSESKGVRLALRPLSTPFLLPLWPALSRGHGLGPGVNAVSEKKLRLFPSRKFQKQVLWGHPLGPLHPALCSPQCPPQASLYSHHWPESAPRTRQRMCQGALTRQPGMRVFFSESSEAHRVDTHRLRDLIRGSARQEQKPQDRAWPAGRPAAPLTWGSLPTGREEGVQFREEGPSQAHTPARGLHSA